MPAIPHIFPNRFPACYFPPIAWYVAAIRAPEIWIEAWQPYRKQQLSSRMHIRVANRVMPLTLPIKRRSARVPLLEKELSYAENWPHQHWQSLVSAYRNSPYFAYYEDELYEFIHSRPVRLWDMLWGSMELVSNWAQLEQQVHATPHLLPKQEVEEDYIHAFDPSRQTGPSWFTPRPYPQVFEGFEAHLSIFDLLCNLGPESKNLLIQSYTP